jgi:hypothetical protein
MNDESKAAGVGAIILALIPGFIKLVESALDDDYDQQKELDAIIKMQRATADVRARKAIANRQK